MAIASHYFDQYYKADNESHYLQQLIFSKALGTQRWLCIQSGIVSRNGFAQLRLALLLCPLGDPEKAKLQGFRESASEVLTPPSPWHSASQWISSLYHTCVLLPHASAIAVLRLYNLAISGWAVWAGICAYSNHTILYSAKTLLNRPYLIGRRGLLATLRRVLMC